MKTAIQTIAVLLFFPIILSAQSIDIYRGGTFIKTVSAWPQLQNAIADALAGDSLVMSPHLFKERRIRLNKSLIIKGTQTATDSTRIEQYILFSATVINITNTPAPAPLVRVLIKDVIFENIRFRCPDADSLYGGAIKAFENTDVTINGNSVFRYCYATFTCGPPYVYAFDPFHGGGAIFSAGKLTIEGNTQFYSNQHFMGGAIHSTHELIVKDSVRFVDHASGRGGAIMASGKVSISGKVSFIENTTAFGTISVLNGIISMMDSVNVINNYGYSFYSPSNSFAGIYTNNAVINLADRVLIGHNEGSGIIMIKSALDMKDSVVVAGNHSSLNSAAGIYNKGGSITISGGQIIGNSYRDDKTEGTGVIYNDTITGIPAPVVKINNARIFNPTSLGKRTVEVFNVDKTVFTSDSTWWGESDTTGLIVNEGSASTTLNSWIIANWSLNKGVPVGTAKSFPVEAYFTLNSGTAIPAHMFWMLKGLYTCDSGSFTPDTADMTPANIIASTYTAPWTTRLNTLLATVDADTLFNTLTVTGLPVKESRLKQESFSVYPNPSNGSFTISTNVILSGGQRSEGSVNAALYDLLGRKVYNEWSPFTDGQSVIHLKVPDGIYIIELRDTAGNSYRERLAIQN